MTLLTWLRFIWFEDEQCVTMYKEHLLFWLGWIWKIDATSCGPLRSRHLARWDFLLSNLEASSLAPKDAYQFDNHFDSLSCLRRLRIVHRRGEWLRSLLCDEWLDLHNTTRTSIFHSKYFRCLFRYKFPSLQFYLMWQRLKNRPRTCLETMKHTTNKICTYFPLLHDHGVKDNRWRWRRWRTMIDRVFM